MAIIDSIKIGQPMPAIIPDQEARGDDIEKIESVDIGRSMTYCYTYIPYYPNNINYAVLDGRMRDAISSRFTGCLMVHSAVTLIPRTQTGFSYFKKNSSSFFFFF